MKILNLSKFSCLSLLLVVVISCKKPVNITGEISGASEVCYLEQGVEYSIEPSSAPDYILWVVPEQAEIISGQGTARIKVNFGRKAGNVCVKFYKDDQEVIVPCFEVKFDRSGQWCRELDFPTGTRSNAFCFSIGSKGYIGMGISTTTLQETDFWEFDPVEKVWTQKSVFPGLPRIAGVGFSIGSKGYVGTGQASNGVGPESIYKDFWEYDPVLNQWSRKEDFIGLNRQYAFGFSIGNKGYIGGGNTSLLGNVKDFYEYDPANGQWVKKDSFPEFRNGAASFAIGNKAYVGTGGIGSLYFSDFYEFDPNDASKGFDTNNNPLGKWSQKAQFPGSVRGFGVGFSLGNYGYMGLGAKTGGTDVYYNDFWKYTPDSGPGHWDSLPPLDRARGFGVGFSIANKGYIGIGNKGIAPTDQFKDFWVYTQ
ncbi:MAG: hypothetical protein V4608_04545 [Bacteroidota bacterium]